MKQRDREALAVYRTALAAIDNAEAVPLGDPHRAGALEAAPIGIARADAPRRLLTEGEMVDIVAREVADRNTAAELTAGTAPDRAQRLHREGALLQELVDRMKHEPPTDW